MVLNSKIDVSISIIVPVYKVEKELPKCVDSLLGQTYGNIEIILIDDGSPDHCPEMCDKYKKMDDRVKVIHKANGGLSDARNAGLSAASGDFILFVDSDDFIETNTCESFVKLVCKHEKPDVIVGEAEEVELGGKTVSIKRHTNLETGKEYTGPEYIKAAIHASQWYAPVCFSLYRRDFFVENHLIFKVGILHEDMEILPKVFLAAKKVLFLNQVFYHYIRRVDSITTQSSRIPNCRSMLDILSQWKIMFDTVQDKELRDLLYGYLAKQYLYTCRVNHYTERKMPRGIDGRYLIRYALNSKELVKAMVYLAFPRVYASLKKC